MSLVDWQSPLGVTVIVLFCISVILYVLALIKKDHIPKRLTRPELDLLIKERSKYLKPLEVVIKKRLEIVDGLAYVASQCSLDEYQQRYLPFQRNKKPLAIQNALFKKGFMWNNHYYQLLKDTDSKLQPIMEDYKVYFAQIKDNSLRKYLNKLWMAEHMTNSFKTYAIVAKGDKRIPHTPHGLNVARIGENINESNIDISLKRVMERIHELLEGAEDE